MGFGSQVGVKRCKLEGFKVLGFVSRVCNLWGLEGFLEMRFRVDYNIFLIRFARASLEHHLVRVSFLYIAVAQNLFQQVHECSIMLM